MTHAHDSSGHGTSLEQPYFSPEEWQALHASDISACRAIVILLLSILTTGLFLYLGVAWWVAH